MIERRIVKRYASALFGAASKAGIVDLVESDLGLISYTVESAPSLMDAITSPVVPASKKRDIIKAIFEGKIDEVTLNYLYLLVDKRREEAILRTEEEYVLLANDARGVTDAEVISAVELTEEQVTKLKAKLGAITGKSVNLILSVDPSIIGGLVVKLGDTLIDGSIKGQLAVLRENLMS